VYVKTEEGGAKLMIEATVNWWWSETDGRSDIELMVELTLMVEATWNETDVLEIMRSIAPLDFLVLRKDYNERQLF
jgi:hypothetical protein